MRKVISLFFAYIVCAGLLVSTSACGGSGGGGNPAGPTQVTPAPVTIEVVEFRIAPTGLGDPLGAPVNGPVTVGTRLVAIMSTSRPNTDRTKTITFKVVNTMTGREIAKSTIPENLPAQAGFPAGATFEFMANEAGLYVGYATYKDAYGESSKESPALPVVR